MINQSAFLNAIGQTIAHRIKDRIRQNRVVATNPNARKKTSGTTLVESSRLMQSIRHRVVGDVIYIGTNVVYAEIHHTGGPIHQKWISKRTGKEIKRTINIPQRPYMFLDESDVDFIKKRIIEFMEIKAKK